MPAKWGGRVVIGVACAVLGSVVAPSSSAALISISNPTANRAVLSENDVGLAPGDFLSLSANVSPNPRSTPPDFGTVVTATQSSTTANVGYFGSPAQPNLYAATLPFSAALADPWTLTATNAGSSNSPVSVQTNAVKRADGSVAGTVDFVRNMYASGTGTGLTFNFSPPAGYQPDSVGIRVYDLQVRNAAGVATLIHSVTGLSASTTSIALPATLSSGAQLQLNHRYAVAIALEERNAAGTLISVSRSFFDFIPMAGALPPQTYLPTITSSGAYTFHVDVDAAGNTIFVDPLVAIGYTYETGAGDPNFASVLLPTGVGDNLYDLWTFDGANFVDSGFDLAGGVAFDFLTHGFASGLSKFQIRGIETSAFLDPANPMAFVTGLSFVSAGQFTGSMTPLTTTVPEPVTAALVGLGIAGLCFARRRR